MFAPEGWSIAGANPQINSNPTQLFIDAIEDSTVLVMHKPKFNFENLSVEQMQVQLKKSIKRAFGRCFIETYF